MDPCSRVSILIPNIEEVLVTWHCIQEFTPLLVRTPNLGNPWHQKTKHMSGGNAMEKLDSAEYFTKELLLLLLSCFSRVRLCAIPEMAAHWAPLSLGFSRQEHWSGCHFLLQWMKVKSESEVVQSCPTPSDSIDCSPPGSSVHGIFQVRVVEWGAIAFSSLKSSVL